jgi:hypothetical protein
MTYARSYAAAQFGGAAAYGEENRQASPKPAARPGIAPTAIAVAVLLKSIHVLEAVIDQETEALRSHLPIDLKEFNRMKSQALVELTRGLRPFEGQALDSKIGSNLSRLRKKLDTNREVLHQHLEAVREISTMLCDAIRDLESDGTYSRGARGYGG